MQGNAVVSQMWAQCLFTRDRSRKCLDNLGVAADPTYRVGLKAYASIFYAMSMETLVQFFEKMPLTNVDQRLVQEQKHYKK